jgi:acetyl esterase
MTRHCILPVVTLLASAAFAQPFSYPPELPGARAETYKTVDGTALKLWIFSPSGGAGSGKRPAIVFFFGGGWNRGSPSQFARQCEYLASRGMVAITADYRVKSRHGVKVAQCVEDAQSAVRYVRSNAARLGIDPNRIAASGGSAGGHLAAATATLPAAGGSAAPNALVLFNPVLVIGPAEGIYPEFAGRVAQLQESFGADPTALSPYHHITKGLPPTMIFHGKADTAVPYKSAEAFCEKMKQYGNRCDLVGFEGAQHGFFNYGNGDGKAFSDTLRRTEAFFVFLGWL